MIYVMKCGVFEGIGCYLNNQFVWVVLVGKMGIINDNCDSWFVGIDGCEVIIVWFGCDDNQLIKLMGFSGVLCVYVEYLKYCIFEKLELFWL